MTTDELYELDRYELLDEFQKAFQVKITEDFFTANTDVSIGTWNTADGYEVYVINNGNYVDLQFESDVYYYQPSCAEIIHRILEVGSDAQVYCDDIDMYFDDEEAIINVLTEAFPDKYFNDDDDK